MSARGPRDALIAAAAVFTPETELSPGWVRVADGRVAALGKGDPPRRRSREQAIDAAGLRIAPGFVDIHVHGGAGADLMDGADALEAVAAFGAAHGCTTYLPTTVTALWTDTLRAVAAFADACERPPAGARPAGIHLEGPFLNAARAGMQPAAHMRPPSIADAEALTEAGRGRVRTITLAPELPRGGELIAWCTGRDVVAAIGHSDAAYDEAVEAVAAGAARVTHCFNASSPLHHRAPGVVGAALDLPALAVEAIADGIHVHPAALRLLWRVKGPRRMALVTDAMAGAGAPDGIYRFGGQEVSVRAGRATLADGTLAGSVLTMDAAVRRMVSAGVPQRDALVMATLAPAAAAGLRGVGTLSPGGLADMVALRADLTVAWTMVGGEVVWRE